MSSADSLRLPSACPSDLPSATFPSSLLHRLPLPAFTRSITLPHALAYNRLYMLQYISKEDYKDICDLPNSRVIFTELHKCYKKLGPQTQILLLDKAIRMEFTPGICL